MLLVLGALVLDDDEPALPYAGDNWLAEMDLHSHTFVRYCNRALTPVLSNIRYLDGI